MSKAIRSFLGKIRSGKQIKSTTPPQKPEDPRVIAARSVCWMVVLREVPSALFNQIQRTAAMLETDAIPQTNEAQKIEHGQDPTITSDQHQSLFIGLRNSPADMSHARPAVIPHRNHRIICYDHRPIFPGGKWRSSQTYKKTAFR